MTNINRDSYTSKFYGDTLIVSFNANDILTATYYLLTYSYLIIIPTVVLAKIIQNPLHQCPRDLCYKNYFYHHYVLLSSFYIVKHQHVSSIYVIALMTATDSL